MLAVSFIVFWAYLIVILLKYGIQKSISQSYYCHNNAALWYLWMVAFALPMIIMGDNPLMFAAGGFIIGVGASPDFKKKTEGDVHVANSYLGIILGIISLGIYFGLWWLVGVTALVILLLRLIKISNLTWWVEVVGFMSVWVGLLLKNNFCIFALR